MEDELRIKDASGAKMAAQRQLENEYGKKLVELKMKKCWYVPGKYKNVWELEGTATIKKGLFGKENRIIKWQIDPISGAVIGFEE